VVREGLPVVTAIAPLSSLSMPSNEGSGTVMNAATKRLARRGSGLVVVLVALLPVAAAAQAYRCEVNGRTTFQQAPCNDGKRVADGVPTLATPSVAPARGAGLCEAHARTSGAFVDPESLRIAAVRFAGAKAWRVHEEVIAARTYTMRINARNEQGGFDGEKLFECLLSEDEARVLHFARAGTAAPATVTAR
jgi:Domain of unknown function (DUF4124)